MMRVVSDYDKTLSKYTVEEMTNMFKDNLKEAEELLYRAAAEAVSNKLTPKIKVAK